MNRRSKKVAALLAALVVASALHASAARADAAPSPEMKAHLQKLDSGSKTIDVSKYPAQQKAAYGTFVKKCSKCHTIARSISSDFVLPAEWQRYIKRMMYKPNSQMNEKDGKTIYQFLVYDGSVRKAGQLKKALAGLTPKERDEAVEKVKTINPSFTSP